VLIKMYPWTRGVPGPGVLALVLFFAMWTNGHLSDNRSSLRMIETTENTYNIQLKQKITYLNLTREQVKIHSKCKKTLSKSYSYRVFK